MGLASTLSSIAPYHVLLYSLSFGATTYQSFFSGLVAFRTLPYKEFSLLQNKIFPPYFAFQLVSSSALFLTHPGNAMSQTSQITIGIAFVGAVLNTFLLGPQSHRISKQRVAQIDLEGKSHKDPTASDTMKQINKKFAKLHGMSVLVNMAVWVSLLTYGVDLTETLTSL